MSEGQLTGTAGSWLGRLGRKADGWIVSGSVDLAPARRSWPARAVLGCGIAAYLWVYMSWTLMYYSNYVPIGGGGYDFSINDQALWLLSRLHSPFLTISGTQYFADHLPFIMVFFVPLYWIFSTGKLLLVLQALALGLAAIPAFLLAREKLRSEVLAAGIALAYLVNPYIAYTNMESFHPDVFVVPLLFLAFWFLVRRRWVGFFVCIVLMLLVKEDVPLLVIGIGIWVAIRYHRRLGLLTVVLGAVWLFVSFRLLLPLFNGPGGLTTYVTRHQERIPFGGIGGFLKTLVTRPWQVADQVFASGRPWYYLQVLGPLAFLSFLSPLALLLLSGPLLANGLSTFLYQHQIEFHYGAMVVPAAFVAAILGLARLRKRRLRQALVVVLLIASCLSAWLWGPLPHTRHPMAWNHGRTDYSRTVDEAIALIPADAVVAADSTIAMHLDRRREIYELPNPWYQRNWGAGDATGEPLPDRAATVEYILAPRALQWMLDPVISDHIDSGEFKPIFDKNGVVLLQRQRPADSP
jgi:uncharacterized membrane protein